MKQYVMENIKNLPRESRPREKLIREGSSSLTDTELMAAMLGSGGRKTSINQIAESVIRLIDRSEGIPSFKKLMEIGGIGQAKAVLISSAFELARRIYHPAKTRIIHPEDILPLLRHYTDRPQEFFFCITLNGAHETIAVRTISVGLVNRTMVHPREVFADAIKDRAVAVIVAHNHPSGNLDPSNEDKQVTARLIQAGQILGIQILDHIVFSNNSFYSFLEEGQMEKL